MIRVLGHWFRDPLGDTRKDVYAEVELKSQPIYMGGSFEPVDVEWRVIRLSLNDADVMAPYRGRFAKVTQYVLEHAA